MFDHDTYISPLTWRYSSDQMRWVFSEKHKRLLLRKIWVALAKAENKAGIVTDEELEDLIEHQDDIDIERASEIEREIQHDLMAEIRTYAEKCPIGGGIIHLGATSMDILDNADIIRQKEALLIIEERCKELLRILIDKARENENTITMAFTHLQPAEPTTVGYRLSQTIQDLYIDLNEIVSLRSSLKGKGLKGAVGTGASYTELLKGKTMSHMELEREFLNELDLDAFKVSTQTYSRKQDLRIIEALSNLASTLHKFALDLRVLQSPVIGEESEPFGKSQVGSSAMPFKKNPINAEKIDSLTRLISSYYSAAWENSSLQILERTLDDSANRRLFIPESFLIMDEVLLTSIKIAKGLTFYDTNREILLEKYGIFSSSERLLMALTKKGADRQYMHEIIREESIKAWKCVQENKENPLKESLLNNEEILRYMTRDEIESALSLEGYIGSSAEMTESLLDEIEKSGILR